MTNNKWEELEKQLVGKNKHSVFTRCLNCNTWGVCFPLDWVCGNCGKDTDTYRYYDLETIQQTLQSQKEEWKRQMIEEIEGKVKNCSNTPTIYNHKDYVELEDIINLIKQLN